jgi:DMSO/TMAO reductase YedYZ molybdopterin-dependent catalytic subunit
VSTRAPARSALHDERVAAILGIALGVSFAVCFATGVLSHLIQKPPSWFEWPARPAGLYRVTQGVHVATGIAAIPLLFAKLWVVFPKLLERPMFASTAHALERISLIPLIGGGIFQLTGGVANINQWYPWPFGFKVSHYWVAWITIGGLIVHVVAKWASTAGALRRPPAARDAAATDRRSFRYGVFATSGLLTLFTVGQTVRPLERLALLAPRRPSVGPQGVPVNRTARGVGVVDAARSDDYRLRVEGDVRRPLVLTRAELAAMPQHEATLPIACVEGWSASARWRGVRVRDLLRRAGAPDGVSVVVRSLQGGYSSELNPAHATDTDTLLALELNGEPLHLDHGYPCRLIGPNRPGTMQTKWVTQLVVR